MIRLVGVGVAAVMSLAAAFSFTTRSAGATPGPPSSPEYWFDSWQIASLWADGIRGQGITIAEIDSGVNAKLSALRGRVLHGKDFGKPGDGHIDRDRDEFGHGTAMASIMVARPGPLDITGIAPGARILPISVPLTGTTTEGLPDRVPEAIRYAANHHAKIISMSLGGKRSPRTDATPCSDAEQLAIYHALRKGALVIAAVGNTGPTSNAVEDPGVCLGVVSVGAVDTAGTVANFSGRQPYLTLAAPGVNIPSLGRVAGQAFAGDGTSQATALTSATAALVWSAHPELDARGVLTRILATLDSRRSKPSSEYGYGLLDAYAAVTAHVPATAANPVFDKVGPFMARSAAFARTVAEPAPATTRALSGSYRVGSIPWLTAEVRLGIELAAGGLALLLMLTVVGVRSRRARRGRHRLVLTRPAPAQWAPVPAGSAITWSPAGSAITWPSGAAPRPARPRPGPPRSCPRPYPVAVARRPQPGPPHRRPTPGPPRRPTPGPPRHRPGPGWRG